MQYLSFLASVFKSILDLGKICCSLITIKYLEEIKSMLAPDLECKPHTHTHSKIWSNSAYSGDSAPGIEQH